MLKQLLSKLHKKRKKIIGAIGMGFISNIHFQTYSLRKDVVVKAISDSNQGLLLKKSRELGINDTYPDYHFLLKDKEIEIVDIMLPHYLHKQCIVEALKAGKTVICEKPLVTNTKDIKEIIKLVKATNKKVYVKQYLRYSKAYNKAKELLTKGLIGKPYLVNIIFTGDSVREYLNPLSWRGNIKKSGGGILMDIGVHILDLLYYLFGKPQAVYAETKKISHNFTFKGEDLATVLLNYKNNILVNLNCTHNDIGYKFRWEVRIYGKQGVMTIIDEKGKGEKILKVIKKNKVIYEFSELEWWRQANIRAIHDIIECIEDNRDPVVSLEEAEITIRTIENIYHSAKLNKKIFFKTLV